MATTVTRVILFTGKEIGGIDAKHHDRRNDEVQWAKEPRPEGGRQMARFGASGALAGAYTPLSRPFLPKRAICRSQLTAIYESMT